jgi:hypothetical protein
MKIDVLSPLGEVKAEKQTLSRRETDLSGKTVVLFGNGKPNVDVLFDNLEKLSAAKFPDTKTVRKEKNNSAFSAPEELLQEIADEADFIVCGVGD